LYIIDGFNFSKLFIVKEKEMKKLTQEEFIEKAKKIFPQYLYDKVKYINNKTDIIVTCPEHGDFNIRPDCLLNGTGCDICGGTKKMTTEDFVRKANYVHNGYFTYENCIYIDSNSKVTVTCPKHGDFEVKANNHLSGCNCKKCLREGITHEITKLPKINKTTKKLTNETFIEKAKQKWGDRYTYEKVEYVKNKMPVIITCQEHGDFQVTPNHFLSGRGCPKCAKNYKYSTEEFIEKVKDKYGDRYLYDKIDYISTHKDILIGCKKHGYFPVSPSNFLKGEGCPTCSQSKLENEVEKALIDNNIEYIRQYKSSFLGKMSLDFFIPFCNIGIECQGIQHYEPVDFFGGSSALLLQEHRDKEKYELCKKNGIEILYYTNLKKELSENTLKSIKKLINRIKEHGKF